ncbi:hypothetical protein CVT25_005110 [Psilocybe cyanescens]|uniref:Uncharacterized protein n=1 Tax=Psilocybe cyanescens TaxID=93625 RepID=A0A409XE12_PSICY|nr:hypothetical protein CVT25_005110 [Psilocybe cyanescens]
MPELRSSAASKGDLLRPRSGKSEWSNPTSFSYAMTASKANFTPTNSKFNSSSSSEIRRALLNALGERIVGKGE